MFIELSQVTAPELLIMSSTVNALTDALPSNIPTLSYQGKNWSVWETRFTTAIQGKGRWPHFDGSTLMPTYTEPTLSLHEEVLQ